MGSNEQDTEKEVEGERQVSDMSSRLILGDCLEVLSTLNDDSIDAIITDPPYGINYQSARRIDKNSRFPVIAGDNSLDFSWIQQVYRVAKQTACLFVFCRWDVQNDFYVAISKHWRVRSQVIWDRGVHGLGDLKAQYAPMHDVVWFATKGKWRFPNRRPKSVLSVDRLSANELLHPTQKPLALMEIIVRDLTAVGDTVLDPFAGSGTTGVACAKTGRNFIGIEIDQNYFTISENRIKDAESQMTLPLDSVPTMNQLRMDDQI